MEYQEEGEAVEEVALKNRVGNRKADSNEGVGFLFTF